MKIEYLYDEKDINLIRLYDFNEEQALLLYNAIDKVVVDKKCSLNINELNFIERINCDLIFNISDHDYGIKFVSNEFFICELTIQGYIEMLEYLEPFTREINGYQWLTNTLSDVDFLFSQGGEW